jgi:cyanophycin synthetase
MRLTDAEAFTGPNVHAPIPVVRSTLDLSGLAGQAPVRLGDRFRRHVLELVPNLELAGSLPDHCGSDTDSSGFALLFAEVALELQRNLGAEVTYRRVEPITAPNTYCVIYELWDEGVALPAAQLAVEALLRLIDAVQSPTAAGAKWWNTAEQRERMLKQLRPEALDLITMAMVREAVKRGIPWYRLVPRKPFVQLGQGHRQKHIRESATSHTSSTARYLSKDKNATSLLLARIGIPVPRQRLVTSVEQALQAAEDIGYPVVTKPLDRGNGRGVSVGLAHADALRWGFAEACKYGEQVIVEQFVAGEDHRILVINGRMVAAAKRIPGHVVGDGDRTIAELVAAANEDPRRGHEYDKLMVRLEFDAQADQVLAEAGLTRDSVPSRGEIVPLRRTANVSTGGTCVDVTEIIHPDNRDAAIRASRVLDLNIAGADFLSTDIARSYREIGGGICEVNFSPGLRPHWNANPARDVVGPIVDTMFPPGAQCRIPIVALTGAAGVTEACRLLAHMLGVMGQRIGMATQLGAEIDGCLAVDGNMANVQGARTLLFDPSVEAAIVECAADDILRHGLAFRACDVTAVLDLNPPEGITRPVSAADHARASRVVVQAATRALVLNADDALCLMLSEASQTRRLCLISVRPENQTVAAHVAAGGLAAVLAGSAPDALILYDSGKTVLELSKIATGLGSGPGREFAYSALCAAASAYVLGVGVDRIRDIFLSDVLISASGRENLRAQ